MPVAASDTLRSKLGRHAWVLLQALSHKAVRSRVEATTTEALCQTPGFESIELRAGRRAIQRLQSAGLVKQEKVGYYLPPTWVLMCTVRGRNVSVTGRTDAWLRRADKRGGVRMGSGRPVSSAREFVNDTSTSVSSDRKSKSGHRAETEQIKSGQRSENQKWSGVHYINNHNTHIPCSTSDLLRKSDRGVAAIPPSDVKIKTTSDGSVLLTNPLPNPDFSIARLMRLGLIPPYPLDSVLPAARVPQPPMLDPDAKKAARLAHLRQAFSTACRVRTGRRGWVPPKHDAVLLKAAHRFIDKEISPILWCVWSVDVWLKYGGPAGKRRSITPTATWVFSEQRLVEKSGWFRKDAEGQGTRLQSGPVRSDLLRRYQRMIYDLRATRSDDPGVVREIVQRYFVDWDAAVAAANEETAKIEIEFAEAVAKGGVFLW